MEGGGEPPPSSSLTEAHSSLDMVKGFSVVMRHISVVRFMGE